MHRPSTRDLDGELAIAARDVALRLRSRGHRAWIVGGAVRDLAVGRRVEELDMASSATPEDVEGLFEHTHPLGRDFGTVLVRTAGQEIQHTTFRSDGSYSDARHPDQVVYGRSVDEDAARRDFTCNAMYLDPLDDSFEDPQGGLADLEAGVLRCVGDPAARFREDALRMVRMARFAAALDVAIDPAAEKAAALQASNVAKVAVERVLAELALVFSRQRAHVAVSVLQRAGLLEHIAPGQQGLRPNALSQETATTVRNSVIEALNGQLDLSLGLCALLDPRFNVVAADPTLQDRALEVLSRLRPSRRTRAEVQALWLLRKEMDELSDAGTAPAHCRSRSIRLLRSPEWRRAAHLAEAWREAQGLSVEWIRELRAFADGLDASALFPRPWIASEDLARAGIARGPAWKDLLMRAESAQLDGRLGSRDEALRWLASEAARGIGDHDGGKTRRNP